MNGLWKSMQQALGRGATEGELMPASSEELRAWLAEGDTVLVDIREAEEHAREAMPGSVSVPLSRYPDQLETDPRITRVVFHCQSGARTRAASARLARSTTLSAYVLVGGLNGWTR